MHLLGEFDRLSVENLFSGGAQINYVEIDHHHQYSHMTLMDQEGQADERSCGTIDRKAIWGASFVLDGGAVLAGVGFYTAEADTAMVGGEISGDPGPGPEG
jgi:hypothetical protein